MATINSITETKLSNSFSSDHELTLPATNNKIGQQTASHQRRHQRRSLKSNELIHRMLGKYNMSHLFPALLSSDDVMEVIAYLLVEREDLLLLTKLESENATIGLLATNNKSSRRASIDVPVVSPTPADYFYSAPIAGPSSSNNDEEINFFAAVHREVVNALAEENQKLQDKVIEERIHSDELRRLVFILKSRLALLGDSATDAVDDNIESATALLSSSVQQMSRSKSQPCSLITDNSMSGGLENEENGAKISSSSSEQLENSVDNNNTSEEQQHNYKKRMQILSHVITAMQKHYMSEIGLLRKEVQRLRVQQ